MAVHFTDVVGTTGACAGQGSPGKKRRNSIGLQRVSQSGLLDVNTASRFSGYAQPVITNELFKKKNFMVIVMVLIKNVDNLY